jgi:GNAT superfamily N-acetyltransferase
VHHAPTTSDAVIHADRALARRLERAEGLSNAEFVDARAAAFPDLGCQWIEVAGTLAMFDGPDSPCTQTFGLGIECVPSADGWQEIEGFFCERGADVFHEVSPLADAALVGLLNDRGYRPCELSTVLVRRIAANLSLGTSPNASISVREIESHEHVVWAQVAAAGWADVAPGLEGFLAALGQVNPHRPHTHCFVAEQAGRMIAVGATCLVDRVAVMAGACTVPAARRQGAQLALVEARLRFAAEHGCDLAMQAAAPGSASQRNAERQGFQVAYTRTKWRKAARK